MTTTTTTATSPDALVLLLVQQVVVAIRNAATEPMKADVTTGVTPTRSMELQHLMGPRMLGLLVECGLPPPKNIAAKSTTVKSSSPTASGASGASALGVELVKTLVMFFASIAPDQPTRQGAMLSVLFPVFIATMAGAEEELRTAIVQTIVHLATTAGAAFKDQVQRLPESQQEVLKKAIQTGLAARAQRNSAAARRNSGSRSVSSAQSSMKKIDLSQYKK
uniref:LAA1-like C-terminal TPR repeats domain-containing protein n=1 Tax=Octactis speculum TaxID=3111310 RepID=A0A7S2G575_9STRA|mmetsp:Transcript_38208/g.51714  ORF Transcript_38208/g.51714 Transcript_38208/m.51714 type:complete len:221 (+) Transcript_38208:3-665(+)